MSVFARQMKRTVSLFISDGGRCSGQQQGSDQMWLISDDGQMEGSEQVVILNVQLVSKLTMFDESYGMRRIRLNDGEMEASIMQYKRYKDLLD